MLIHRYAICDSSALGLFHLQTVRVSVRITAHRDPGGRGQARQLRRIPGARVLDPAPEPEGEDPIDQNDGSTFFLFLFSSVDIT